MVIVAIDTDDLADGSGKAHITWIGTQLLAHLVHMNSTETATEGYGNTQLREYLHNTVMPMLPLAVSSAILEVSKTQSLYENGTLVRNGQTTAEKLWVPSVHEVGCGSTYESVGPVYRYIFISDASRLKERNSGGGNVGWATRTTTSSKRFGYITTSGRFNVDGNPTGWLGVLPCFCT